MVCVLQVSFKKKKKHVNGNQNFLYELVIQMLCAKRKSVKWGYYFNWKPPHDAEITVNDSGKTWMFLETRIAHIVTVVLLLCLVFSDSLLVVA